VRDAELDKMLKPFDGRVECSFFGEGANMQLINDGRAKRAGLPVLIVPLETRVVDVSRRAMYAVWLARRTRIGKTGPAVDF